MPKAQRRPFSLTAYVALVRRAALEPGETACACWTAGFRESVMELTNGCGADVIYDLVGRDPGRGAENVAAVCDRAEEGRLHPQVWLRVPFGRAIDSFRAMKERRLVGKAVITFGS